MTALEVVAETLMEEKIEGQEEVRVVEEQNLEAVVEEKTLEEWETQEVRAMGTLAETHLVEDI